MTQRDENWIVEEYEGVLRYGFKAGKTLYRHQSAYQLIEIVETAFYGRMLLLDGMVMTTEQDEFIYHEMLTHIPMLAHPGPERVLIIGGGDGGTVREALKHPSVAEVVLCEIDGEVITACKQYLPTIAGLLDDPRVNVQVCDGVAYIAEQENAFDIILIDSTDPVGPAAGLSTEEFYRQVQKALRPGGIMAGQTQSPVANAQIIREIYTRLKQVFPLVVPYVATIPTYPGWYWSWAFCSEGNGPLNQINHELAVDLEQTTRFYNRQVHRAVFALPNFVRERIQGTGGFSDKLEVSSWC